MEEELTSLGRWLGITGQQSEVLRTIHKLRLDGHRANPKGISLEYRKDYSRSIQISNLFHVLDALMEKKLVKKDGPASYDLNINGIERVLSDFEQKLGEEMSGFKKARSETVKYLNQIAKKEKPTVRYMDLTEFFDSAADSVSRAKKYYMVAHFPKLFHPMVIKKKLSRYEYLELIEERCFVKQNLDVNIMTDLDIDFLYKDFSRFFPSEREALKAALSIIDQIQYAVDHYKHLRVYYTKKLIGMDMLLPICDEPKDLYFYMRDQEGEIIGGVYIESSETAKRAYSTFTPIPSNYTVLEGTQGKRILKNLKREIRARFG